MWNLLPKDLLRRLLDLLMETLHSNSNSQIVISGGLRSSYAVTMVCREWNQAARYLEGCLAEEVKRKRRMFNAYREVCRKAFQVNEVSLRLRFSEAKGLLKVHQHDDAPAHPSPAAVGLELWFVVARRWFADQQLTVHWTLDDWKTVRRSKGKYFSNSGQEDYWHAKLYFPAFEAPHWWRAFEATVQFAAKIEYAPMMNTVGRFAYWDNNGQRNYMLKDMTLLPFVVLVRRYHQGACYMTYTKMDSFNTILNTIPTLL
eukprot:TRINITY_DN4268_c0_g1_i8.p1 TRINITY_DN4268_c0_g1~~TRINITY_DN4268_c0_g1_i8.p1  ORF type:complete len:258 (-),score=6.49 TRINITY_DN4268_c0_g1_i8:293-1066(-)